MKTTITESQLRNIVSESVTKVLNEVIMAYQTNNYRSFDKEYDSNPNNEVGTTVTTYGNDGDEKEEQFYNEDIEAFAQRLEKITHTEWIVKPHNSYHSYHNYSGYDSFSESDENYLYFLSPLPIFIHTQKQLDALLGKLQKMAQVFFGITKEPRYYKDPSCTAYEKDGEISIRVYYDGFSRKQPNLHTKGRKRPLGRNSTQALLPKPSKTKKEYYAPYTGESFGDDEW